MKHIRFNPLEVICVLLGLGCVISAFIMPLFGGRYTGGPAVMHVSNFKQIINAQLMYPQEHDYLFVPLGHGGSRPKPWTTLVSPYLKYDLIFGRVTNEKDQPNPLLFGTVGLNYSAWNSFSGGRLVTKHPEAFKQPGEVYMLVSHAAPPTTLRHAATGIPYVMSVEPPVCPPDNELCLGGWGTDFWVKKGRMDPRDFAAQHGRVAPPVPPRDGVLRITVGYVDGHAARLDLPKLTEGTDCATPDEVLTRPCKRTGTGTYRWGEP